MSDVEKIQEALDTLATAQGRLLRQMAEAGIPSPRVTITPGQRGPWVLLGSSERVFIGAGGRRISKHASGPMAYLWAERVIYEVQNHLAHKRGTSSADRLISDETRAP